MSTQPQESFIKWVSARIADVTDEGVIARLELFHVTEGEGAQRLQVFRATGDNGFDEDAHDLAQALWDIANEDAETRDAGMPQRYTIQAYRNEAGEPEASHSVRIVATGNLDYMSSGNTDKPTRTGQMSQEMRHTENLHRLLLQMTEMTAGRMMRDLESERKRRESAENKLERSFELQQSLLDRQHERDLEAAKEESKARRHEEFMGLMMSMAPLLLSKFLAGGAPISQSLPASSARDQSIGKLLKSLSPKEAMKVFESLEPQNQLALAELYKSYKEDDAAEQEKKPALFRDNSTEPSSDEDSTTTTH